MIDIQGPVTLGDPPVPSRTRDPGGLPRTPQDHGDISKNIKYIHTYSLTYLHTYTHNTYIHTYLLTYINTYIANLTF